MARLPPQRQPIAAAKIRSNHPDEDGPHEWRRFALLDSALAHVGGTRDAPVRSASHAEEVMALDVFALLIGVVAGLRTMTAPAAVSWAAHFGLLRLDHTPLAVLGARWTPILATVLALCELVVDPLPTTPSRKGPPQFGARILTGGLSGAAIGVSGGSGVVGLVCGVVGAVFGTLVGADLRGRLARAFRRDLPAALLEDCVAIGGSLLIVYGLST